MNIHKPLALLGQRTAAQFMRDYWQKRPLLVKQALPGLKAPVSLAALKKMAKDEQVQSRLIWREQGQWHLEHGPFGRLPKASEPHWTLLIQSLDIHSDAASELMHQFDFIPAARLDDLMVSVATEGGGVGPHFDSYDVFLIQAAGKRHWKYGQQRDLSLVDGLPLKILKHFEPEQEAVLEPGDLLYLPPQVAHDGVALTNDCMTLSVGFRAPTMAALAQGMLEAAAEQLATSVNRRSSAIYRDPRQPATQTPGQIPQALIQSALKAASQVRLDRRLAEHHLGCWLTEPNALAVFDAADTSEPLAADVELQLDRRSRMLYCGNTVFINGEVAPIKLQSWLKTLIDERRVLLTSRLLNRLTSDAGDCLHDWLQAGWMQVVTPEQKRARQ